MINDYDSTRHTINSSPSQSPSVAIAQGVCQHTLPASCAVKLLPLPFAIMSRQREPSARSVESSLSPRCSRASKRSKPARTPTSDDEGDFAELDIFSSEQEEEEHMCFLCLKTARLSELPDSHGGNKFHRECWLAVRAQNRALSSFPTAKANNTANYRSNPSVWRAAVQPFRRGSTSKTGDERKEARSVAKRFFQETEEHKEYSKDEVIEDDMLLTEQQFIGWRKTFDNALDDQESRKMFARLHEQQHGEYNRADGEQRVRYAGHGKVRATSGKAKSRALQCVTECSAEHYHKDVRKIRLSSKTPPARASLPRPLPDKQAKSSNEKTVSTTAPSSASLDPSPARSCRTVASSVAPAPPSLPKGKKRAASPHDDVKTIDPSKLTELQFLQRQELFKASLAASSSDAGDVLTARKQLQVKTAALHRLDSGSALARKSRPLEDNITAMSNKLQQLKDSIEEATRSNILQLEQDADSARQEIQDLLANVENHVQAMTFKIDVLRKEARKEYLHDNNKKNKVCRIWF